RLAHDLSDRMVFHIRPPASVRRRIGQNDDQVNWPPSMSLLLLRLTSPAGVAASGCKTLIAYPTSRRSPSQPGIEVRASMWTPCVSCSFRSASLDLVGTAGVAGTSGSDLPSGRRNNTSPLRARSI